MDYLNVSHANTGASRGRRRALSINSVSEGQQIAMNSSIENLQGDISLVNTQWHNVLTSKSNPLELALAFLDDTSVGLGHRYKEFNQLEGRVGLHLQEVVNEHSQAFNANVASYSKTVAALTDAQDRTSQIKKDFSTINGLITKEKGSVEELDKKCLNYTNLISTFATIEELLQIPENIENNIKRDEFNEVQSLIQKAFIMLNLPNLRSIEQLKPIRQQIELQEHTLFENVIQEITNIIYSKKGISDLNSDILQTISISQNGFSTLENYLYNIANIDIIKQSEVLNSDFNRFVTLLNENNGFQDAAFINKGSQSEYYRLFSLLSLVKGTNRLPTAISILNNRAKEEIHNIILKSTEEVRLKHPTLLKMVTENINDDTFGLSIKQVFSLIIRECFWEIFLKLLLAVQRHKAIFEIVNMFQINSSSQSSYPFEKIWDKFLVEIRRLLTSYLYNPHLIANIDQRNIKSQADNLPNTAPPLPERKYLEKVFTLQDNIDDNSMVKEHAGQLKTLLKDIFLGFTVTSNMDLNSVYIHDETFEKEEALIPPTVFNMKVILEPFLLFSQASSNLVSTNMEASNSSFTLSLPFFNAYMDEQFLPRLRATIIHLFVTRIESNNPYAVESIDETKVVLKSAVDFQKLFYNLICVLNVSNTFRQEMVNLLLELLSTYFDYYSNIFNSTLSQIDKKSIGRKNLLKEWLHDDTLSKMEEEIINGESDVISVEVVELFKHCPDFYKRGQRLRSSDHLSTQSLETALHLTGTIMWILSWLPLLKKRINTIDDAVNDDSGDAVVSLNADELRNKWAFFEYSDLNNMNRESGTLDILLNPHSITKFDGILDNFKAMKIKLLSLMRFDLRSRCIYNIGKLFQTTTDWKLEVNSSEVDTGISTLISQLKNIENKFNRQLMEVEKDILFSGIDAVNNRAFIQGGNSISVINKSGIRKIIRNINVLQHGIRNLYHDSTDAALGNCLTFYTLAGADERELVSRLEAGELAFCSQDDLKTILRLQFSEELQRQSKRASGVKTSKVQGRAPFNDRYERALKQVEVLTR